MRKYLPVLHLTLALGCLAVVWWMSQDVHDILGAVFPIVVPSLAFANVVASIYVGALIIMSFLAGVFTVLFFATPRMENKE